MAASGSLSETGHADVMAYAGAQKSTGVLIISDQQVVVERNWPLPVGSEAFATYFAYGDASDGALLEDVASLQISFIAILVGMAVDRNLLDVSKPVSAYIGASWSQASADQECAITVPIVLQMNSGLAADFSSEARSGSKFFNNTTACGKLKSIPETAF